MGHGCHMMSWMGHVMSHDVMDGSCDVTGCHGWDV